MTLEDAVWLIFNRWLQENDFKYLDRHLVLISLTAAPMATLNTEWMNFE